jgi:hypothetical protein
MQHYELYGKPDAQSNAKSDAKPDRRSDHKSNTKSDARADAGPDLEDALELHRLGVGTLVGLQPAVRRRVPDT